jgi:hypothetical protein
MAARERITGRRCDPEFLHSTIDGIDLVSLRMEIWDERIVFLR